MKKMFYTIAIVVVTAFSFSACTKEEVRPKTDSAGGHVMDKGI
jgi:hypothetical protein